MNFAKNVEKNFVHPLDAHCHGPAYLVETYVTVNTPIYVTGQRFDRTGPLAWLSPFPIQCE